MGVVVFFLLEKSGFCASGWRYLSDAVDIEAVATGDREGCFSYPESNLSTDTRSSLKERSDHRRASRSQSLTSLDQ